MPAEGLVTLIDFIISSPFFDLISYHETLLMGLISTFAFVFVWCVRTLKMLLPLLQSRDTVVYTFLLWYPSSLTGRTSYASWSPPWTITYLMCKSIINTSSLTRRSRVFYLLGSGILNLIIRSLIEFPLYGSGTGTTIIAAVSAHLHIHVSGVANTLYSTTVCVFLMIQCINYKC